jgi:putative DNA primase/helicase
MADISDSAARVGTSSEDEEERMKDSRVKEEGPTKGREPPIRITATVLNIDRGESYYEVSYIDLDGVKRSKRLARELFLNPGKVAELLIKAHADLPDDREAAVALIKNALSTKDDRKYSVTARSGWHDEHTFVSPTKTFGRLADDLIWDGSDIDHALGQTCGTLSAWREGMREPVKYSDFLVFACSVPGASSLLDVIGEDEGAVFHFHGIDAGKANREKTKSSSGKSLAARGAASTIGRCRKNDLVTFAASTRGVEDYCAAHSGFGAFFDEEGRALGTGTGPRIKSDELPYLVASGRGGLRSTKATRDPDLENLTWSLFAISTGEDPLDGVTGRPARPEGAQVRMCCVPVPAGKAGGIFNRVDGTRAEILATSKRLARQVEETIAYNYGVVAPAYLSELVADRITLGRRVRRIIDKFVKRVGADTDPWERRFAEKFGIVLAASILMSEFQVAPWDAKRARRAIRRIYQLARSAIVSVDEAKNALIRQLRKLVLKGERFPRIRKGQLLSKEQAAKAWGVTKNTPQGGRVVLIPHRRVVGLVKPAAIAKAVLDQLAKDRILARSSDGKLTRLTMIKALTDSKRRRYLYFPEKALLASA